VTHLIDSTDMRTRKEEGIAAESSLSQTKYKSTGTTMHTEREVAVIGCGVIGLTTAILLLRNKCKVNIYTRDLPHQTASSVACATWLPFGTSDKYETGYLDLLKQWSRESISEFSKLTKFDSYGVRWIRDHELFHQQSDVTDDIWQLSEILPNFEAQTDKTLPDSFTYRVSFDTFVIETLTFRVKSSCGLSNFTYCI